MEKDATVIYWAYTWAYEGDGSETYHLPVVIEDWNSAERIVDLLNEKHKGKRTYWTGHTTVFRELASDKNILDHLGMSFD